MLATLTSREAAQLRQHEDVIESARRWAKAEAQALLAIRDAQLYRANYPTFEKYVETRWKLSVAHAYRQCEWAATLFNISPSGEIGPMSEGAARPLYGLTAPQQRKAWDRHQRGTTLSAACETIRASIRAAADQQATGQTETDARVICADVLDGLEQITDNTIAMMLTSPPYAGKRAKYYPTISEKDYPAWCVCWMTALKPKLTATGNVIINIRPHVHNGELSDYVLRTRLALRDDGWIECDEMICDKPDAQPIGHRHRPRRCYEQLLWYSTNRRPYCDVYANGTDRAAMSKRDSRHVDTTPIRRSQFYEVPAGRSRTSDVFRAPAGGPKGFSHPAAFPTGLADQLTKTFSRRGDLVLDCFAGSGTTLVSALGLGRRAIGIEIVPRYASLIRSRLSGGT